MAAKKTAAKVSEHAKALRDSPYVQRFAEDEDLRRSLADAYRSLHHAYERYDSSKKKPQVLFDDKKLKKDLRNAVHAIQDANQSMRKPAKRSHTLRRLVLLSVVGAIAAVVFSESARNKVLDLLFGAEEKFEYQSPTTVSETPTPATASSNGH